MKILDELERLSKAATPGPWERSIGLSGVIPRNDFTMGFECGPENAELIALMRNHIDALIKVARAAQVIKRKLAIDEGYVSTHCEAELGQALAELERGE